MAYRFSRFIDPIYGPISFSKEIAELIGKPIVQRLRHIRLSNIDSINLPGIAGITRFEHVLGTAYLASRLGFLESLPQMDRIQIIAACLLHDSAITPFGHLVEEAMALAGQTFDHQEKWALLQVPNTTDVGDIQNIQLLNGRHPGLKEWIGKVFGDQQQSASDNLLGAINGKGIYAPFVCGTMDLDNIDNVFRAAYHIGIKFHKETPLRLVEAIKWDRKKRTHYFLRTDAPYIEEWLSARNDVYSHFMLAEDDFVGKIMMIHAVGRAIAVGALSSHDWRLTDAELICRLNSTSDDFVSDTMAKWNTGELWSLLGLWWIEGPVPSLHEVQQFFNALSIKGVPLYSYRIKDKRTRRLSVRDESGAEIALGQDGRCWLLGVATPAGKVTAATRKQIFQAICLQYPGAESSEVANAGSVANAELPLFSRT